MKKTFLKISIITFSVFLVTENADAWNPFRRNRDADSVSMSAAASGFSTAFKLLSSISTSADSFTQKNFTGEESIDVLLAYRVFTKNCSELFNWLNILTNSIKTGYDGLKKATVSSEKATSERATTRAETSLANSKDKISNAINVLTGPGFASLFANVKASAIIYMKIISGVEFSNANIDNVRKNSSALKAKLVEISGALDPFSEIFQKISTEGDIEVNMDKINGIKDDVNLVIDIMRQIDTYLRSGEQASPDSLNELINRCSLASKRAPAQMDDGYEDEGYDDDDYQGGRASRGMASQRRGTASQFDDDDDEGGRTSRTVGARSSGGRQQQPSSVRSGPQRRNAPQGRAAPQRRRSN